MNTIPNIPALGLGIAWRPPIALDIAQHPSLGFVEIMAESVNPNSPPPALLDLRQKDLAIIPHGLSLSLGSAEPINPAHARHLANLAKTFDSPFVSEHLAFVRAGDAEAGHLLPVPRTRIQLQTLVDNIRRTQDILGPTPLALENISALFDWPSAEFSDAEFLTAILEKTNTLLLLDTSNVYANAHNLRKPIDEFLDNIPLHRLAYCHVGGGAEIDGVYHDTHTDPLDPNALAVLESLCSRITPPAVLLERDDHFPPRPQLYAELDQIKETIIRGTTIGTASVRER